MIFERLINWQFAFVVIGAIGYWTTAFGETTSPSTDIFDELPRITPDEPHLFLEVGSNFTLECSAASNISWFIVPLEKFDIQYSYGFNSLDPLRPHGVSLNLYNISAENVGYYYCVDYNDYYDMLHFFNTNSPFHFNYLILKYFPELSKVYIFVKDITNLLVPSTKYQTVWNNDITVPCKPTDCRDTIVELTEPIHQVRLFDSKEYNATVGFTTFKQVMPLGVYVFYCKATSITNGMESKSTFYLTIGDLEETITITSNTNGQFAEGANITLNCLFKKSRNTSEIIWDLPQNINRSDPRVNISFVYLDYFKSFGESYLVISNVTIEDTGIYNCAIKETESGKKSKSKSYKVDVLSELMDHINLTAVNVKEIYYMGSSAKLAVQYHAYPPVTLTWYKPNGAVITPTYFFRIRLNQTVYALLIERLNLEDSGVYSLEARNEFQSETLNITVNVVGKPIVTINNTYVEVGKEATVVCKVEAVPEINELIWTYARCYWYPFWPFCEVEPKLFQSNRNVSNGTAKLIFKPQYPGEINCTAVNRLGSTSEYAKVLIGDVTGNMTVSGIDNTSPLLIGTKVELTCAAPVYYYKNNLKWYKNNKLVHEDSEITITSKLSDYSYKKFLTFKSIQRHYSGDYECRARYRKGGVSSRYLNVIVEKDANNEEKNLTWTIAAIAILIVLLILLIISISYLYIRQRRAYYGLRAAGLASFEKGAIDQINQALGLHEQADLLPYDKKLEFPREKLRLGKQIGAGFFGLVFKASAEGICPDETETTVAVKMVKRNADNEVMKAMVSELKIMVHLGKHLNVVNLLGAVTKNILKRDVLMIVEYCKYGNVESVLLNSRKRFIDQINPETDQIDRNVSVNSCAIGGSIRFAGPHDDPGENTTNSSNDLTSCVSSNMEDLGDETIEITTTNLVSWASQVAGGMDYLSSRNVLHGDLAARNILLCDDNIVKICDFGLARSMYGSEMYKKREESRLPMKWLALESMSDRVFSTKTDVWAFGIVLWEFFSLATVPYPGMPADQSLYLKLRNGYRMLKPQYANAEIYDIMMLCWSPDPEERPIFKDLELSFAVMCDDEMRNRLLVLNERYQRKNTEHFSENTIDLLALAGSSNGATPIKMRYVNDNIKKNQNDGYMVMLGPLKSGKGYTSNAHGYVPPTNFKINEKRHSLPARANRNLQVQYVNDLPQPTVESFT